MSRYRYEKIGLILKYIEKGTDEVSSNDVIQRIDIIHTTAKLTNKPKIYSAVYCWRRHGLDYF